MYHPDDPDDPFDRRELELETLLSTPNISRVIEMTFSAVCNGAKYNLDSHPYSSIEVNTWQVTSQQGCLWCVGSPNCSRAKYSCSEKGFLLRFANALRFFLTNPKPLLAKLTKNCESRLKIRHWRNEFCNSSD